jgi:hypothetical protein
VVRSSPLRTGRLYPQEFSWYSFLEAESTPERVVPSVASEKVPSDTTGDRSRDPPISSAVLSKGLEKFRHNIKVDFEEVGLLQEGVKWINLTQDSVLWRFLLNTVIITSCIKCGRFLEDFNYRRFLMKASTHS